MEKGLWVVFFFTLILVDANQHSTAAETNVNATDTNNHGANFDTNKAVIVGQEKKGANLDKTSGANLDKTSKINEDGSSNVMREESLEEPKSMNNSGNPRLDNATSSKTSSLEDFHAEGCDPSDSCIDEKDMFVACLRVPGEDSLHLSLLIQNKGSKNLDVKIVPPDFVHPGDALVSLKPKLDREVKVFLEGARDATITLVAKDGNCSLSLRNTIFTSIKNETSRLPEYLNFFSTSIFLAAVIFAGAAWLSIRFWSNRASRYQKVNMVLPVSTGGTAEANELDGWDDNSWGEGWDDEAPKTPSKPVSTPSFKGLASRKSNKDGWND